MREDVAKVREETKGRSTTWTIEELRSTLPQPIGDRKTWKLSASHNNNKARESVDGNRSSRFDTGTPQVPGMWFQIELPESTEVSQIILDTSGSDRDSPRGYEVRVSDDGKQWSKPIAKGKGNKPITEIYFKPVNTKFIRITQTGSVDGLFWSIHELGLYKAGKKIDYASAPKATTTNSSFE